MRTHDDLPTIWILIANASKANFYQTKYLGHELTLVKEYDHPENRKKGIDLVTDRPGHYESRGSAGHGAFVERHDPKETEADHFAQKVAEEINKARASNAFDKLILIAPSHFHGLLKKHLDTHVLNHVLHHVEKDYTHFSKKELLSYLDELPK